MKKLILSFILLSSLLSVDAAFACDADACSTAPRYTGNNDGGSQAGTGSISGGGSSNNTQGAGGQVAGETEGNKKAEEAKDAYCAQNPTAAFCIARAKDKACKAGTNMMLQANSYNKTCTYDAASDFQTDRATTCAESKQKTSTNGITLANGGSLVHSSISISGISVEACLKIAQDFYSTRVGACNNSYTNDVAAAKALLEQCPK